MFAIPVSTLSAPLPFTSFQYLNDTIAQCICHRKLSKTIAWPSDLKAKNVKKLYFCRKAHFYGIDPDYMLNTKKRKRLQKVLKAYGPTGKDVCPWKYTTIFYIVKMNGRQLVRKVCVLFSVKQKVFFWESRWYSNIVYRTL